MPKVSANRSAAVVLLFAPVAVLAHHGTAGSYDQSKLFVVQGTVQEFRWRNPHSALFVLGKDAAGKDTTYVLEMGSPNTLVKMGYKRDTFKPGDKVMMDTHPSFTNPANLESLSSHKVLLNGKELQKRAAAGQDY
jgi:hypothetical protein